MDEKLLISAVEKHPIIYDRSRPDFKDVVKRRCSWDIISKTLNVHVNQCMRTWRNIRERYGRELKILRTNPDDSAEVAPKWDLFENLSFLKSHIKARKRANSCHTSGKLDEHLLIETVEKYPMIYDKCDMDFKNTIKKEECWNEIARSLDVPAKDCEHTWKNLRERYAKERKRLHITQEIISRWPLYTSLTFLDCHVKPRRTNNLTLKTESWNSDTDVIDITNHKTETPDFEFVEESQVLDDISEIPETSEKMTLSNIDSSPITSSSILIRASKVAKIDHTNEHGYVNLIPSSYVESNNQGTSSDIAFGNYVGQYLSELADIKKKNKLKLSIMQLLHGDE
ncbi:hypothetical protein ILUMI_02492 [Ignelater luminosus]|uniref:MADF domain-containing protein n=1 Tax=Ignelater luminosus TaxID=2038154 RepID=A0A8K0DI73_IGNLU|nr:hypothetical protein ILUMI_02492 [Ignelater luminosus]